MAAASYESLPLSLTFGINIALFLEPVSKYGNEDIKRDIFNRFLHEQNMGGLMINEPAYGSDALTMKTAHRKLEDNYRLEGSSIGKVLPDWLITGSSTPEDHCQQVSSNGILNT